MLYSNYKECQEEPTLDKKDIEDCAIDLEYSIFSSNTNMTMYRNAMAKMVSILHFFYDEFFFIGMCKKIKIRASLFCFKTPICFDFICSLKEFVF